MKARFWMLAGTLALTLTFGFAAAANTSKAADIAEVMTKGHKGKDSLKESINAELKKSSPDWKAVQEKSAEFVTLAEGLGANDPPKGSKDGWKKQCEGYVKIVKELNAAADKKNKSGCTTAMGKLNKTCGGCHNAHKGS